MKFSAQTLEADSDPGALLGAHNDIASALTDCLTKGLTFSENMNAALLSIDLTMPDVQWIPVSTIGFLNGWSGTAGETVPAFRITETGEVVMRGNAKLGTVASGATGNICVLPAGYRPSAVTNFSVWAWTGAAQVLGLCRVSPDGSVRAYFGANTDFGLDQVRFQALSPAAAPPIFNPGGQQNTGLPGWPILKKHGLRGNRCVGLIPVRCQLKPGAGTQAVPESGADSGMPRLSWEDDGNGNCRIKAAYGLSPGKMYTVTCLAFAG